MKYLVLGNFNAGKSCSGEKGQELELDASVAEPLVAKGLLQAAGSSASAQASVSIPVGESDAVPSMMHEDHDDEPKKKKKK